MAPLLTKSTTLIPDLLGISPAQRLDVYRKLTRDQFVGLLRVAHRDLGTPFGLWADDPVGFWEQILGGHPWSKQRGLCESVRDNVRTVSPASHSVGKTFTAGRVVCWFVCCHPPDSTQVVTTAPRFRQVKFILWPHIHRIHAAAGLPGELDQTQWKIGGRVVAYGFSAPDYDEDAVQGIHEEHVLLVVDEGGGIGHTLGNSFESITSGFHVRQLVIGNPPTDEEGSWFEECTTNPLWNCVRISAEDSPNFTGENVPEEVARNLVDQRWVDDQVSNFGQGSAFVEARVHARFPHGSSNKVIPWQWLEDAMDNPDDVGHSTWIRLGVDVAADGGDEFVIARAVGFKLDVVHFSSGPQNANSTDVAGKIKEKIDEANVLRAMLGEKRKVRVKVDVIGVGWGVFGTLKAWLSEGVIDCELVAVNVSERPNDREKFYNRRAEMWWCGREAVRAEPGEQAAFTFIDVDKRTLSQLNAPTYSHTSGGLIKIEAKADIKKRGLGSPDRGEAILLALYDPRPSSKGRTSTSQTTSTTI